MFIATYFNRRCSKCWWFKRSSCGLNKFRYKPCFDKTRKIKGITEDAFYLAYGRNGRLTKLTLLVSLCAAVASGTSLALTFRGAIPGLEAPRQVSLSAPSVSPVRRTHDGDVDIAGSRQGASGNSNEMVERIAEKVITNQLMNLFR